MEALRVTTANRLESLADRLAAVVARPLRSPLDRETIVVRNPGMERWVTLALARRLGVWANATFPLPNAFLDALFRDYLGESPAEAWRPDVLVWRVQRLLPGLLGRIEFAPLRAYLEGETGHDLKRWQLAGRIADLLDQYLVYRPDWVEEWRRGALPTKRGSHRDWQAVILQQLWEEGKAKDRAAVRRLFLEALRAGRGEKLPARVSVFGIAALPQFHLETLAALAEHVEVNLFLLNPSRAFWFESIPDRRFVRQRAAEPDRPLQRDLFEELPSATQNQLLASMGSLGGEVFGMLLDLEPLEEQHFVEPAGDSLLARLQRAILDDEPAPAAGRARPAIDPADRSLQVHSCHGPLREIEVLRDQILALFQADPSLKPEEIVVMAPEIETYVPYIEAVFRRDAAPLVPFNLSDRKLARASSLARTFLSVMHLPQLRFAAPDVLDVLESEPVRRRLGLAEGDLGRIRQWVVESGIRWGIDAAAREALGLPGRIENTWRFGLRRLLLGTALEGERVFEGVLPLPPGGERETLAVFVDFVERLIAAVAELASPRPLAQWSVMLDELLRDLFAETAETAALAAEVARLAENGRLAGFEEPVPVEVVAALLATRLDNASPGLGFLTEGVTFCSLLPMRSIPFRVICLLGMGFGSFPRADAPIGFDLMAAEPRSGDRSRRNDDRYLFLETIVSARDTLYLSYVGRSAADGKEMAPSVLVSELLEDVRSRFDVPFELPLVHALHAWSPRYFDGADPRLFSYSSEMLAAARETARIAASGATAPRPMFLSRGLPPVEGDRALSFADLESFYRNAARHLLRRRLEIVLRARNLEIEAREPFEVGGLERYLMANDLLERLRRDEDVEQAREVLRGRGGLPHGMAGEMDLGRLEQDVRRFYVEHAARLRPERRETMTVDVAAGPARITDTLELWDGRLLRYRYASAKGVDRLGLWIRHLAACRAGLLRLPSAHLASDGVFSYAPLAGDATGALDDLVALYVEGQSLPLCFFADSSLAFAEAVRQGKSEDEAMRSARSRWQPSDRERGRPEGEDPSVRQLFGSADPLAAEFRRLATRVYGPMLAAEVSE